MAINVALLTPRIIIGCFWLAGLAYYIYSDIDLVARHKITSIACFSITNTIFIILSPLWIWCYYICCWGDPGYAVPENEDQQKYDSFSNRCPKCNALKPQRSHHCSVCNKCVYRFDHHCPFIGNCVGLYNYKGFVLMPIYGSLLIATVCASIFVMYNNFFGMIMIAVFAVAFFGFGFSYCPNIIGNFTTLESIQAGYGRTPHTYDRGLCNNLGELSKNIFDMLLPTRPPVDGFYWSIQYTNYEDRRQDSQEGNEHTEEESTGCIYSSSHEAKSIESV